MKKKLGELNEIITVTSGESVSAGPPIRWLGSQRSAAVMHSAIPFLRGSQIDAVHTACAFGRDAPQSRGKGDIVLRNVVSGKRESNSAIPLRIIGAHFHSFRENSIEDHARDNVKKRIYIFRGVHLRHISLCISLNTVRGISYVNQRDTY